VIRIRTGRTRSKSYGLGAIALAGAVIAFVFAATGSADPPAAGLNCQASGPEGKIEGRGATFQFVAQMTFIQGFQNDECGPVGSDVGGRMVIYNDAFNLTGTGSTQGPAGLTGSGAGRRGMSCRTDAFAGSDIPYDVNTLGQLNGNPGAITGGCTAFGAYAPLFQPTPNPYPNGNDDGGIQIMSFPVAISSVVVGIDFGGTAGCPNAASTAVQITGPQLSQIYGGEIANWNTIVPGCNLTIKRAVRQDDSGTTQNFKGYLQKVDGTRGGAQCDSTRTWNSLYLASPNTQWPGDATGSTTNCQSPVIVPATSGGPALLALCTTTAGAVCYADAADVKNIAGVDTTLTKARIRNGDNTSFQGPFGANLGTVNCSQTIFLPNNSAVGLDPTDSWAFNQPSGGATGTNHANVTNSGPLYPICGMTWDLVYTGIGEGAASANQPISRLNDNQRRTLYSYVSYILSKEGQDLLTSNFYQRIAQSTIDTFRTQFQANFSSACTSFPDPPCQ